MSENRSPNWSFLTHHAQALVCVAQDPGVRLRDIGDRLGITERAAHRIVAALIDSGYISRQRTGRRSLYSINTTSPLPDPIVNERQIGQLLEVLTGHSDDGSTVTLKSVR
jgi:predicted DNA-binding transcriptional regulator